MPGAIETLSIRFNVLFSLFLTLARLERLARLFVVKLWSIGSKVLPNMPMRCSRKMCDKLFDTSHPRQVATICYHYAENDKFPPNSKCLPVCLSPYWQIVQIIQMVFPYSRNSKKTIRISEISIVKSVKMAFTMLNEDATLSKRKYNFFFGIFSHNIWICSEHFVSREFSINQSHI